MQAISYDPSLDRIDVAIRATVKLAQGGRKAYADQIGMTGDHRRMIQAAVRDMDNWREEDNLFHLIRSCPCVLGFALELLRLYTLYARDNRRWFYLRNGVRHVAQLPEAVSQVW